MDLYQVENLMKVIREVHSERADDLCWLDIDRIFKAAGLPVPDRSVGDKEAMHKNCGRFLDIMCQGGKWKSYVQLEAELAMKIIEIETLKKQLEDAKRNSMFPQGEAK